MGGEGGGRCQPEGMGRGRGLGLRGVLSCPGVFPGGRGPSGAIFATWEKEHISGRAGRNGGSREMGLLPWLLCQREIVPRRG